MEEEEQEEEGGRPASIGRSSRRCPCPRRGEMGRARETTKDERGGGEKLDREAEARVYICFSGFRREAEDAEEKRENPRRSARSRFR